MKDDVVQALQWALDYIDAIPSDVASKFPAMPGFDRDAVEDILEVYKAEKAEKAEKD